MMINSIRKKAEQALVGAVVKFHYRHVDRVEKYRKIAQAQSRRSYQETNQSSRKAPARNRNTSEDKSKNELAEVLKAKNREVGTLLEQMRAQANNKKGGVRVCGDAVLRYIWCGFAVISILTRGIAVSKH